MSDRDECGRSWIRLKVTAKGNFGAAFLTSFDKLSRRFRRMQSDRGGVGKK
jgi:hypothetical protein